MGSASGVPVPAKASVTKMAESSPSPTTVDPIVRAQRKRPPVATFMRASTAELRAPDEIGSEGGEEEAPVSPEVWLLCLLFLEKGAAGSAIAAWIARTAIRLQAKPSQMTARAARKP